MAIDTDKISVVLRNFVGSVSNVQGAVISSSEGLPLASYLPSEIEDERVSAVSATLLSMGERVSSAFNQGVVERIYIQSNRGFSILTSSDADTVLFVLANEDIKQGVLLQEINRIIPELKHAVDGGKNWSNSVSITRRNT
ncbi:roadblock/LC7 domain-containing protein [Brasilonema sp. UFV-L1]|uniref:roadblock/LC7 domain-containing protein n=1 Tax=Brasilonema sp. UFV-L1 TaxID=2234130 RepID=UPI00145C5160|nr:roadblock/LC7 domain-containing protein [Brasilonema sp. UFV-L1]NMG09817.1 diacylglyceryl transferase [Brasilonema sp. UFV-L1]